MSFSILIYAGDKILDLGSLCLGKIFTGLLLIVSVSLQAFNEAANRISVIKHLSSQYLNSP